MNRKMKIFLVLFIALMMVAFNGNCLFASNVNLNNSIEMEIHDGGAGAGAGSGGSSGGTVSTPSWWQQASGFLSGYQGSNTTIGNTTVGKLISFLEPLVDLVKVVGNMVFVAVTVILGVKYIWGGVEGKADVKDSLITLVVAAIVFYGWNTISALFMIGDKLSFIGGSFESTAKSIYSTILYVCNFLAFGGIVAIGIKYMMAGAEGKSQLKGRAVPMVLGIVMVYATITFLNFIVGII